MVVCCIARISTVKPELYDAVKLTITLDVPMKPVDVNGNVGEYVTEIEIGGYEGRFLLY